MSGTFTDPEDLSALFSQAESLQKKYEETGRRCVERNGDMLKYMGTPATVRDMIAMADALDGRESPVNYYGFSYGTLLGNLFLNSKNDCPPCQDLRLTCLLQCSLRFEFHHHCLAPFMTCIQRVGRVILDSVVDPAIWLRTDISLVSHASLLLYMQLTPCCELSELGTLLRRCGQALRRFPDRMRSIRADRLSYIYRSKSDCSRR